MLTEADKKWLHRRKKLDDHTFCWHCPTGKKGFPCTDWLYHLCPTQCSNQDFEDAAEFEARVAAKLAQGVSYGELPCGADPDCPDKGMDKYNTKETPTLGCRMCVLRAARLEVETKMEESRDWHRKRTSKNSGTDSF